MEDPRRRNREPRQRKEKRKRLKAGKCPACAHFEGLGNKTEPFVCVALGRIKKRKAVLYSDEQHGDILIEDFFHIKPNSQLDEGKIDFLLLLSNKGAIALQVKSGPNAALKHIASHPYIPCIAIRSARTYLTTANDGRFRNFLRYIVRSMLGLTSAKSRKEAEEDAVYDIYPEDEE